MKMVFEEDIEKCDFLEFILSPAQATQLLCSGVVSDFPYGLSGRRNLNVFLRVDTTLGEEYAVSEGKGCEIKGRIFGKCSQRDGSGKAAKTSRSNSL
jgi:hypothetical protein